MQLKDYTILSIVLMLFLFYPTLVKLTLSMLKCPSVGHEGYMFLMADLQEPCFIGRHKAYIFLLTIPQLVCYVLGLPLIAAILIFRNKEHLYKSRFSTRYSLLYIGYRKDREWWELIIALRKIAVVSIGTFGTVMGVVDLQAFIALGTVFISIVLHLIFQPFDTATKNGKRLHNLEFIALCVCWFTFWGGLLFFLGHEKSGSVHKNVLIMTTILLVIANCSFLLVSSFIFGREYLRDKRIANKKKLDKTHKNNADSGNGEESKNGNGQNSTQVVPIRSNATDGVNTDEKTTEEGATVVSVASIGGEMDHEQHIDNVIDEHHGHEARLNALHRKQSKRAKRNTQLRLLERSKIKSLKILAQVPGFSQLNEIKISKMVDNMKLIKYQPGDVICQEGDAANSFYVILEGNCAISSLRHGSRRMATIGEMDFFGEGMMTTNEAFRTRGATVTVVPESEENDDMRNKSRHGVQVLVLERKQYDTLCNNSFIDSLSNTEQNGGISLGSDIEKIVQRRKQENRENLVAGRAMNRLRSLRKEMGVGGKVKTKARKDERDVPGKGCDSRGKIETE